MSDPKHSPRANDPVLCIGQNIYFVKEEIPLGYYWTHGEVCHEILVKVSSYTPPQFNHQIYPDTEL